MVAEGYSGGPERPGLRGPACPAACREIGKVGFHPMARHSTRTNLKGKWSRSLRDMTPPCARRRHPGRDSELPGPTTSGPVPAVADGLSAVGFTPRHSPEKKTSSCRSRPDSVFSTASSPLGCCLCCSSSQAPDYASGLAAHGSACPGTPGKKSSTSILVAGSEPVARFFICSCLASL